jgi:Alginate lyase
VPPSSIVRISRWIAIVVLVWAVAAGCGVAGTPHPTPEATPTAPSGPVALAGWKLTLPVAGRKGDAATVDPATVSPPWLVADGHGGLTLWAPVAGATTPNSGHTRTELDSLSPFLAGLGRHVLTAAVTVAQLPRTKPDVILGQIHGSDAISSVPFVMLHDEGGKIDVVVKQQRSGPDATQVPLLAGVPLGTPFTFSISDDGNGTLTFTATADGHTATGTAPVPAAFDGAPVRFQAGDYQQADTRADSAGGAADDGARVTFHALDVGP